MAQVAHVLYCVEVNATTQECTQTAWMPAPSLVPPLTEAQTLGLMSLIILVYAAAYAPRMVERSIRGR